MKFSEDSEELEDAYYTFEKIKKKYDFLLNVDCRSPSKIASRANDIKCQMIICKNNINNVDTNNHLQKCNILQYFEETSAFKYLSYSNKANSKLIICSSVMDLINDYCTLYMSSEKLSVYNKFAEIYNYFDDVDLMYNKIYNKEIYNKIVYIGKLICKYENNEMIINNIEKKYTKLFLYDCFKLQTVITLKNTYMSSLHYNITSVNGDNPKPLAEKQECEQTNDKK